MPDYLVQEDDTSKLLLEDGSGALLLETSDEPPTPPGWASVGSLGCASEYNFSKYTLEISPTSNVPAGHLVVVWVAWTSHYFFGPNGSLLQEVSCVDDAGNRYLEVFSYYGESVFAGMFVGQVRNGLTTSDTITLKSYGPGAKAACLEEFTLETGKRWAYLVDQRAATKASLADPHAITVNGLDPARDYLMLHVLGSYGQTTDTYIWDADYTQISGTGTTGHGNPSGGPPLSGDIQLYGGWRIPTAISADTVDVTNTGTLRDFGQGFVALVMLDEDDDYPDYPNTPLLDDFNRADEDPNDDGGRWDKTSTFGRPGFGFALTKTVSNQAASSAGGGAGSEWLLEFVETEEDSGEYEEYGTIAVVGDVVLYFGTGDGQSATTDANAVGYRDSDFRAFNGALVPMGVTLVNNSSFTGDLLGGGIMVWGALVNGTKVGLQQFTEDIWQWHLWMDDGAGWEWVAAVTKQNGPDFNYHGRFGIGFEGDTVTRLDDFGGGPLDREAPRIIRRLHTDGHSLP